MSDDPTSSAPAASPPKAPNHGIRVLWWTAALLALLIAIAFVVLTLDDTELDPAKPEGTVQRYLTAALAGDDRIADSYLSEDADTMCGPARTHLMDRSVRVEWIETTYEGDMAYVEVRVTEGSPGLFGDGEYDHRLSYTLERTPHGWLITHQDWPWYECPEKGSP